MYNHSSQLEQHDADDALCFYVPDEQRSTPHNPVVQIHSRRQGVAVSLRPPQPITRQENKGAKFGVPSLSNEQVERLRAKHHLIDPTYDLTENRQENIEEVNEQNPRNTAWLLEGVSKMIRSRSKTLAWGVEKIPETGTFIAAPTHLTQFDSFIPMMTLFHLGRRPRFMAKAELAHWPFVGWGFKTVGMQPVPRNSGKTRAIIDESLRIVTSGRPLTIFPEGTTTRDPEGWPMTLKTGVAYVALEASARMQTQVPIFPIATWGACNIRHWWPWPKKNVVMAIGDPIDYSDLLAHADDWEDGIPPKETIHELTYRVHSAMTMLMSEIRDEEPPKDGIWDFRLARRIPRTEPWSSHK